MTHVFLAATVATLILAIPYLGRVIAGPTVFDRVVALNGIGTKIAVLMVLVGLLYARADMFVDIALAFYLLNLVTTLLLAKYVKERGGL
ncbi:MAG: pH regulation protein F [Planctomycetes bacterium]|nr:pH regulation protein F [Planctomycetota bacterium]